MRVVSSLLALGLSAVVLAAPGAWAATRDVNVEGKPPAEYVAAHLGTSWAVVIGIDDYRHARVPALRYAVNDAVAMERALGARGFRPEHIITLLGPEATKSRIEAVLGDELRQQVGPNDRVLVFFAGHGKTDRLRSGEAEGYLIPVDGDPAKLFSTAISMTALRQISERVPAKHILYVVDACYSGYALFHRAISDELLAEIVKKPAIQILTAGRQQDQAQERNGHGVFTEVLLRGLEGDAFGGKSWLSLEELGVWMKDRVFAESNKKQLPQYGNLSGEGQFVFLKGGMPAGEGTGGGGAALSQAEQELKALEEQERQIEEQKKLAVIRQQIEDKKKKIEEARARPFAAPQRAGQEITGKDGAPMRLVPAGEFIMGSNDGDADEKPERRVTLEAFYLDKYEVSTAQYAKYMAAAGAKEPNGWPTSVLVSNGQKPVVGVSWYEADAYCRYYGKRLPTEQEWEKAARGTDGRKYPWGNEEPTSRHANFNRCCGFKDYGVLVNVGSLEEGKSPYGIYDLAGNAWEWTSSDYDSNTKVLRGGAWDNLASRLETTLRAGGLPSLRLNFSGFRCAQDAS